jgi:hypothetical protein
MKFFGWLFHVFGFKPKTQMDLLGPAPYRNCQGGPIESTTLIKKDQSFREILKTEKSYTNLNEVFDLIKKLNKSKANHNYFYGILITEEGYYISKVNKNNKNDLRSRKSLYYY